MELANLSIWEKAISILADNLNSGHSYLNFSCNGQNLNISVIVIFILVKHEYFVCRDYAFFLFIRLSIIKWILFIIQYLIFFFFNLLRMHDKIFVVFLPVWYQQGDRCTSYVGCIQIAYLFCCCCFFRRYINGPPKFFFFVGLLFFFFFWSQRARVPFFLHDRGRIAVTHGVLISAVSPWAIFGIPP